jgi:hypothetical protein
MREKAEGDLVLRDFVGNKRGWRPVHVRNYRDKSAIKTDLHACAYHDAHALEKEHATKTLHEGNMKIMRHQDK